MNSTKVVQGLVMVVVACVCGGGGALSQNLHISELPRLLTVTISVCPAKSLREVAHRKHTSVPR
jgi:hypothetical protein